MLHSTLINSTPCWTDKSKTNSIWFEITNGYWIVGTTSNLGKNIGALIGPECEDWPHNVSSGWKYHDGKKWADAGGDLVFEALSNGKSYKINPISL